MTRRSRRLRQCGSPPPRKLFHAASGYAARPEVQLREIRSPAAPAAKMAQALGQWSSRPAGPRRSLLPSGEECAKCGEGRRHRRHAFPFQIGAEIAQFVDRDMRIKMVLNMIII